MSELYAAVRGEADGHMAWVRWRAGRDALFREHAQTPLESVLGFEGLPFSAYAPAMRFVVRLAPPVGTDLLLPAGEDGDVRARPFARTEGLAGALGGELTLYWLLGYGGGVFLPFADATSGGETYGGGRYLLDTIKGADLGAEAGGAVLDFNFAYNPSCAYSGRYACPLSPGGNRLPGAVRAGELAPGR